MEKKYLSLIGIIVIATILLSVLAVPFLTDLLNENNQEKLHKESQKVIIVTDTTNGNAPLSVSFKSILQNFDDNKEVTWYFGDGTTSNELNPTHTYEEIGEYFCELQVSDDSNEIMDDVTIIVSENNPPLIKIIVDKTSGNRPLTVNFDVDGFDTDGEIVSYEWEIQYPPFFSYQKITNSDEKNFSEKFIRAGFYEVKLTVTDDSGNVATDYIKIQVLGFKLELFVKTSIFYYGQIKNAIGIIETIRNLFDGGSSQNLLNTLQSLKG